MPHQISAQIFSSSSWALTKIDQGTRSTRYYTIVVPSRLISCSHKRPCRDSRSAPSAESRAAARNGSEPNQSIAPLPLARNAASVHHQAVAAAAVLVMKNQPAPPPDAPRDDAGGGRGAGGAHEPPGAKPAAPLPRFVSFGSGRSLHSRYG